MKEKNQKRGEASEGEGSEEGDAPENEEKKEASDEEEKKSEEEKAQESPEAQDSKDSQNSDQFQFVLNPRPLIPNEHISLGSTLLADLNLEEVSFFSMEKFVIGQAIFIEFLVPENFIITAAVKSCQNYNMHSKIISTTRPQYRLHAEFIFLRSGEKTLLREFVKSIVPDIPEPQTRKKKDDDDDLDDLDDLGL